MQPSSGCIVGWDRYGHKANETFDLALEEWLEFESTTRMVKRWERREYQGDRNTQTLGYYKLISLG